MEFNGTFFVSIITFVVFVFVMNKVLYKPILSIMEERKNLISSNYENASQNNAKADELDNHLKEELDNAKISARDNYLEKIGEFKSQRDSEINDAKISAEETLEHSKDDLKRISDDAKVQLRNSMNDLANDIVEKVIGYRSSIQGFDENKINDILWRTKV